MSQSRLTIAPTGWKEANAFVVANHRHHGASRGQKFALKVLDEAGATRGVLMAGRPVARLLDDGLTLEVIRLATDGCPNACSALYGAARRVAKAMGYRKVITYILATEPGTSLRAAGWKDDGVAGGGTWDRSNRSRVDKHPTTPKRRYVAEVAA